MPSSTTRFTKTPYSSVVVCIALLTVCVGDGSKVSETNHAVIQETPFPTVQELVTSFDKAKLDSPRLVEHAITNARHCRRSVSYLHMPWSLQSLAYKPKFAEFALNCVLQTQSNIPQFHFIDCESITDDYSLLYELPGWNERGQKMAGMAEILWMQDGKVIHVESAENFRSANDLIEKTRSLFRD
ncbi:MAG: hypothetical protein AAFV88_15365 [Planctomycetota bacterium]